MRVRVNLSSFDQLCHYFRSKQTVSLPNESKVISENSFTDVYIVLCICLCMWGVLRFYCRWNYIYGPCILAMSCKFLCVKVICTQEETRHSLSHSRLCLQSITLEHHCKPVISPSLVSLFCLLFFFPLIASCLCRASRVAVIRGSIVLQDGSPLVGVNITFPQHPEYGYTISRQDGR